jgi:uncharacterized membrane protein
MLGEPRLPGSASPAPVADRPMAWKNVNDDERLLSFLAGGALLGIGAAKRGWLGVGLAAIGGSLIYRAATGHCYTYEALGVSTVPQHRGVRPQRGIRVTKNVQIDRTPEDVSQFWGQLTGLPKIMRHLERVDQLGGNRSHWVAKVLGMHFEWDAETTAFVEGREIRWRSLPGGDVDTEGSIRFETDGAGGTIVHVDMRYDPPGGVAGDRVARLLGSDLESQVEEDLRRFKGSMESSVSELSPPAASASSDDQATAAGLS